MKCGMAGVTEIRDSNGKLISQIRKRDGRIVTFEQSKISNAIYKALVATGKPDYPLAERLGARVVQKMAQQGFGTEKAAATVEDVQDMVESILIEDGLADTAKSYILYRHERRKVREEKMKILNKKDLDEVDKAFDINSLRVLAARYLLRDDQNEIIEGPKQMFERVATLVGIADVIHDPQLFSLAGGVKQDIEEAEKYYSKLADFESKFKIGEYWINRYHFEALVRAYVHAARQGQMKVSFKELLKMLAEGKLASHAERISEYYNLMISRDFLPNTPTLMNAGARLGQLSACFVLDMPDDMAGIMKSSTDAAMIFKSGGGVGINYSDLRHEGDIVASTSGVASGPVSFMNIIDTITNVVKQGGKRRGANMGILEAWHPDVEKFVTAKTKPGVFENFNVSVGVWEDFWQALVNKNGNHKFTLRNPRTREPMRQIDAQQLIDLIALSAWKSAEPGIIFFDNINKYNPCIGAKGGPLRATNPCVTSDTWVATDEGPRKVRDLIGRSFKIHLNGKAWDTKGFFSTGVKKVFKLKTSEGLELRLTQDHRILSVKRMTRYTTESEWKEAKDLTLGDKVVLDDCRYYEWDGKFGEGEGYLVGQLIGDGHMKKESTVLSSWGEKAGDVSARGLVLQYAQQMPHRSDFKGWAKIEGRKEYRLSLASIQQLASSLGLSHGNKTITEEIEQTSSAFYKGFMRGLFDTDGTVIGSQLKGVSVRLSQSDLPILRGVQRMLLRLGIVSRIYMNRRDEQDRLMPDGKGSVKLYHTKAQHELVISGENILRFHKVIGFGDSTKMERLETLLAKYNRKLYRERFVATITELVEDGTEEVYDVQVPGLNAFDANGIVAHNCGEQSLYPYESCNLGSINLANFVKRKADGMYEFDWQRYEQAVRLSTRFLDNIIDMNKYPVEEIEVNTRATRRIGLGIMGIADLLFLLRIPYNSQGGYEFMNKLAEAVSYLSMDESVALAKSRGPFPMFKDTDYVKGKIPVAGYYELPQETHTYDWTTLIEKIKKSGIRNSWTSTIAPTGTLSMIADTANGVEPVFALVYEKRVTVGRFFYTDKVFENTLKENGLYSDEILTQIANNYGSVRGIPEIPDWMQKTFVTAIDIHWMDHIMAQAVWQKWISNAIAKTINMPGDVTAEDVKCSYLLSHELGLKGVTVFRDGSRQEQVLHITGKNTGEKSFVVKPSRYVADYIQNSISEPYVQEQMQKILKESGVDDGTIPRAEIVPAEAPRKMTQPAAMQVLASNEDVVCPSCKARLIITEGCNICIECGFSSCASG
jgi:ribonucleoside-diphosphate reductase alpha chain